MSDSGLRLKDGESMASVCREFGISKRTGYKFSIAADVGWRVSLWSSTACMVAGGRRFERTRDRRRCSWNLRAIPQFGFSFLVLAIAASTCAGIRFG